MAVYIASVARGVHIIDTGGAGFDNTIAAYLVVGQKGSALLDTGYARCATRIVDVLSSVGITGPDLRYIIPTHLHLDHYGGASWLVDHYPQARVLVHEKAYRHVIDPSRLTSSVRTVYDESFLAKVGTVKPINEERVGVIHDDEVIDLGGMTLRSIYAPGHAPHHLVLLIEDVRYVVSADVFSTRYPFVSIAVPNTPPPNFDLEEALRSMRRVSELSPRLVLSAHYGTFIPSEEFFSEEAEGYVRWVRGVEELKRRGLSPEECARVVVNELERRLGGGSLHPALKNTAKISTIGTYKYLEER
ncbi:MAG: MBL fold metallo-hydrolase [Aigarchaeota archaeon]|nr:MBL fold metallo-hydrolase [Aigarchaeota archaeon]